MNTETVLNPTADPRSYRRSFSFWRSQDLTVYRAPDKPGDDGRADLATSELLVFSLLANRSPAAMRRVFGFDQPILCVTHSRQPICTVVWDRGEGLKTYIMDGRQRGGDSEQRGSNNPGAIETINLRTAQLVALALEIAGKDSEAAAKPEVLKIKTRNEAKARCKRGEAGWTWARDIVIPLYIGGKVGDERTGFVTEGLIDWAVSPPAAIPYVAWVAFEPEDRDPGTCVTQLASIALKSAQVATPPIITAKQYQSLCGARQPAQNEGETDADYAVRIAANGPYGQGLPVHFVAEQYGVAAEWVHFFINLLNLEPEVQEAIDACARGEEGLSLNQVRNGGFFISTTGRAGNSRIPKSRVEQLRLLGELRGKRGLRSIGGIPTEVFEATGGDSEGNAGSAGGAGGTAEGMNDPSRRREVSGEDSSLARHSANEPRASVGPDSPATAGESTKAARLDGSLFLAMRDRINETCELYTPGMNGKLPNSEEPSADSLMLQRLHDALYHFASYMAGDMTAFTATDDDSPIVRQFRREAKDSIDEVLRARGLTIRPNTGAVATGVPVLPAGERKPAELIVTPRKDGKVKAAPAPKKERRRGPLKPKAAKPAKAPKAAKPVKPAKVAKPKTTSPAPSTPVEPAT